MAASLSWMKTILVIDDDQELHELLTFNLEKAGYRVVCAKNAEQGIGIAISNSDQSDPPDIIILDLMLPGIKGMDAAKCLLSNDATKDIPIIILSAKLEEDDIKEGRTLGRAVCIRNQAVLNE